MADLRKCAFCKHACDYPKPGPEPVIPPAPEPPKSWWGRLFWMGESWQSHRARNQPHDRWLDRRYRWRDLTRCRRYPTEVVKRKTETCSEWERAANV